MLRSDHRMRRRDEFTLAVRRGRRAGRPSVVLHLLPPAQHSDEPALVGFIVAKTVGNAVVRNKVRRRLRHLVADHLDRLAPGSLLVVRANPAAAAASYAELATDLGSALDKLQRSRGRT